MMRFRGALIDGCQLFREGVARLLQKSEVHLVISAPTLSEAMELAPSERPDLALWGLDRDIDLDASLTELHRARAQLPGLRTVVLAHPPDRDVVAWAAA